MVEISPSPPTYTIGFTVFTPGPPSGVRNEYTINVSATAPTISLSLAANFIPLPLCNPKQNTKYQSGISNCVTITTCLLPTLFAHYCADESKALSCVDNYFMSTTQTCMAGCDASKPRSPGSNSTNGICNYICTDTLNCPSSSLAQMNDFPNNFRCNNTHKRLNYKCLNINFENCKY